MNKNKIGNIIKSTDFNKKFFIQEKTISRNKNETKIKFGNKNIFQKIANNLFVEINYRQGSRQHSFISFSAIASANTPAIFYFFTPNFLQYIKCKIEINIEPAVYFSKIANTQIQKTIYTLDEAVTSHSKKNQVFVSDFYAPEKATTTIWQGEGYSDKVKPQQVINLLTTPYITGKVDDYNIGHYHQYKMAGEISTIITENVYHKHNFSMKAHWHSDEVKLYNHSHIFGGHIHSFSSYSHNHKINLQHNHELENNIYSSDKKGYLSEILLDNSIYINKSEIDISSNTKHTVKIYINGNISKIQCNIEIIGNYI